MRWVDRVVRFFVADVTLVEDVPDMTVFEQAARIDEAVRLVDQIAADKTRAAEVVDLALEVRQLLRPAAPDPGDLREVAGIGYQYRAPVIPGRQPEQGAS